MLTLLTILSGNKVSKDAAKPSRDRASALFKNCTDIEKLVDSNGHDAASQEEFSGNCSKTKYAEVLKSVLIFYFYQCLSHLTCIFPIKLEVYA
jgi:hypothetical protein